MLVVKEVERLGFFQRSGRAGNVIDEERRTSRALGDGAWDDGLQRQPPPAAGAPETLQVFRVRLEGNDLEIRPQGGALPTEPSNVGAEVPERGRLVSWQPAQDRRESFMDRGFADGTVKDE